MEGKVNYLHPHGHFTRCSNSPSNSAVQIITMTTHAGGVKSEECWDAAHLSAPFTWRHCKLDLSFAEPFAFRNIQLAQHVHREKL